VLQKHEEAHKEWSFTDLLLCLDGHPEQFCDECRLPQAVSFTHASHLPFPHHVDCFLSLQCSRLPSRTRKKPMPGLTSRLMRAVVLFNQVIEVFALPELTRSGKSSGGFQFTKGCADTPRFCRR
jgi:hypothetical protein